MICTAYSAVARQGPLPVWRFLNSFCRSDLVQPQPLDKPSASLELHSSGYITENLHARCAAGDFSLEASSKDSYRLACGGRLACGVIQLSFPLPKNLHVVSYCFHLNLICWANPLWLRIIHWKSHLIFLCKNKTNSDHVKNLNWCCILSNSFMQRVKSLVCFKKKNLCWFCVTFETQIVDAQTSLGRSFFHICCSGYLITESHTSLATD